MLSKSSRLEIVRKIDVKIGYPVREEHLTPATRQAITNLATVQRHLFVIMELLRGENRRMEGSAVLRVSAKMGMDSEKKERAALADELGKLQTEIDSKVSDLAAQVVAEENARLTGVPPPLHEGKLELVEFKCPSCGAPLPLPTGRLTTCKYCNATLAFQDVSTQLKSMIQGI